MTQLMNYLSQKREVLNSTPRIHVRKSSVVACACNPSIGEWRQVDTWGLLASWASQTNSERSCLKTQGIGGGVERWLSG